jgi:hypothetical protein
VPRFIPDDELARLMTAVKALDCPYQRATLLVARWSGARKGEIRRLAVDCLDAYPDGTPRLRLPVGKTRRERMIPLHDEAALALREVFTLRMGRGERAFTDEVSGVPTYYLFMEHGKLLSDTYLSVVNASWTSQALKPTTRCSQRIVDMRVRGAMTPPVRQELWAPNVSMLRSFHIAERSSAPKIARLERHGSTIFLIRNCQGMWLDRYFGRF